VLDALAAGQLSINDAVHVMQAITQQTRIVEADELERRVSLLVAAPSNAWERSCPKSRHV
jgi:hypothetical protein